MHNKRLYISNNKIKIKKPKKSIAFYGTLNNFLRLTHKGSCRYKSLNIDRLIYLPYEIAKIVESFCALSNLSGYKFNYTNLNTVKLYLYPSTDTLNKSSVYNKNNYYIRNCKDADTIFDWLCHHYPDLMEEQNWL